MTAVQGPVLELWKAPVSKGDVPPLQGGEHMTVGQVRHPALSVAFQVEFQKWFMNTKNVCKRWKAAKKLADTAVPHLLKLPNPNLTKAVVNNTTSMLAKALAAATQAAEAAAAKQRRQQRKQARQEVGTAAATTAASSSSSDTEDSGDEDDSAEVPEWEEQHSWFVLPRDIPVQGVAEGTVPESDPRAPLRGQKGIWAAEDLPEGYLIGPYRHYCMFNTTFEVILRSPPSNWRGTALNWRLQLDSYSCNESTDLTTVHVDKQKYGIMGSGYGYGNATAYANDPHLDPVKHLAMPNMPDDYLGPYITSPDGEELPGSVQISFISICGWAYAFMVTVAPVPKGQECLYDYGWGYWLLAANGIINCQAEKKQLEEHQKQLQEMEERLRAVTQMSSGLTTSINAPSSIHPGVTQDTSTAVAAAAARLGAAPGRTARQTAGVPAESAGGSWAPGAAAVGPDSAGQKPAGPQSSGLGVSDMRQQLGGMQLAQDSSGQRDGSGGGVSESVGAGASMVQTRPQQQQQQDKDGGMLLDQQQGGDGGSGDRPAESAAASVGAVAVTASGRASPAEESDDACSAVPLSALSYANLQLNPERAEQLQRRQQAVQQKQHMTQTKDAAGNVQEVKRIDDPDVVQMIRDVQMELSQELLRYPHGIKYSKLKPSWWDKFGAVKHYFYDKWDFMTRHSQLFQLSQDTFSPNTRIELTPEWSEALIAQLRAEGRLPAAVLAAEAAAAGGAAALQQYSSNKRKRGQITLTKFIRDDAAERELRRQLKQKESELKNLQRHQEDLNRGLQQAQQDVQQLVQLCRAAGAHVPKELLLRQQQPRLPAAAPAAAAAGGGRRERDDRNGSRGGRGHGSSQHTRSSRSRSRDRHRSRSSSMHCNGSRRSHGSGSRSRSRSRGGSRRPSGCTGEEKGGRHSNGGAVAAAAAGQPPAIDPSLFDVKSAPVFGGLDSGSDTDSARRSASPVAVSDGQGESSDSRERHGCRSVPKAAASRGAGGPGRQAGGSGWGGHGRGRGAGHGGGYHQQPYGEQGRSSADWQQARSREPGQQLQQQQQGSGQGHMSDSRQGNGYWHGGDYRQGQGGRNSSGRQDGGYRRNEGGRGGGSGGGSRSGGWR